MSGLALIRQLWQHNVWADEELLLALRTGEGEQGEAWREYLHVLGAEEIWLSRLEQREARVVVWPTLSPEEADAFRKQLADGYSALLANLHEKDLSRVVDYCTSDGRRFSNGVGDVLVHVPLHGQYHRGKVNLLLRQRDHAPAPVDFIAFVRGAPAATHR